jgi:hypothetical protein
MNQTTLEANSFSDGVSFEVSTDGGSTYLDMGVMENGYSWTYDFATSDREWGNAENPDKVAKNQKVTIAPSELAVWKGANIAAISGGLMTAETVAGSEVTGASQVVASGSWEFDKVIILDGQMYDGSAPTVTSVTGSVDGAGTLADDYEIVKVAGGWAIVPFDGSVFDTEAQNLTIVTTYTPAASVSVYSGTTSSPLSPFRARFTHYTNAAMTTYDFRHEIFRVNPDAGGITMNKLGSKSDTDYDLWTIALTGEVDTSLEDGKQLDSQYYDSTVYGG